MRLDTLMLVLVVAIAAIWLAVMLAGVIAAFPFGLLGLIPLVIVGGVLGVIVYQRTTNREDDYYDKTFKK